MAQENDNEKSDLIGTIGDHAAPHRTFTSAIEVCFAKYANFKGRASRTEFWWFWLFFYIMTEFAAISGATTGDSLDIHFGGFEWWDESVESLAIAMLFFLPGFAVGARRLHDIGRGGWWQLLIVTGFGVFLLVYWWVRPGDPEHNVFYESENSQGKIGKTVIGVALAALLFFLAWAVWNGSVSAFIKGFYEGFYH